MAMKNKNSIYLYFIFLLIFISCKENYTPKPIGYYRIDFPEKKYNLYKSNCPYSFEYPVYAKVLNDSLRGTEPCWINITFPEYNGKLHLSYKKITNNLAEYIEDSRKFAYKHSIKADIIDETSIVNEKRKVYGIVYDIKGNAASSVQFFLTDSTSQFIRGALYFETRPNSDSLAPVISFFRKDVMHFIETFQWK